KGVTTIAKLGPPRYEGEAAEESFETHFQKLSLINAFTLKFRAGISAKFGEIRRKRRKEQRLAASCSPTRNKNIRERGEGKVCCNVQPKRATDGGIHIEFPVFAWQKHLTDYWLVARPASRWYSVPPCILYSGTMRTPEIPRRTAGPGDY
ncbi:hypothetical protein K0M31_017582, partial [Melipona bicolor]